MHYTMESSYWRDQAIAKLKREELIDRLASLLGILALLLGVLLVLHLT